MRFLPSSAAVSMIYLKPPYAIGSVPRLPGRTIAYRWRSLPRVRRDRASKPLDSSERVLPWQVTMDQLICVSLSHTHYWYEVDMWKVPSNKPKHFQDNIVCKYSVAITYIFRHGLLPTISSPPVFHIIPARSPTTRFQDFSRSAPKAC